MIVNRLLVVRVNIGSLLRYVLLASCLIRKSAATNLAGFVCGVREVADRIGGMGVAREREGLAAYHQEAVHNH